MHGSSSSGRKVTDAVICRFCGERAEHARMCCRRQGEAAGMQRSRAGTLSFAGDKQAERACRMIALISLEMSFSDFSATALGTE